jgi:hypothetical protein
MHVWLNDQLVRPLDIAEASVAPAFVRPEVGVMTMPPPDSAPFDVWFDEIMIDDKRIGCAR